jgi:hypothetical protein
MERPTMSNDTALQQAVETASRYLWDGAYEIDKLFGHGYAKANPELLCAYMKTASNDLTSSIIFDTLYEIAESIRELKPE